MPAPPELLDAAGDKGIVEVLLEVEAEDAAQADGHVAVAAEVKEDLERIADRADPGRARGELAAAEGEDLVRQQAHLVRQQDLLRQTEEEAAHAPADPVEAEFPLLDLGGDVGVAHDGAGDELGEEGDVQQDREEALLHVLLVPVDVDDVAQALEGEEGDADGQADLGHGDGQPEDGVENLREEAGVLVGEEQADVQNDGQDHRRLVPLRPRGAAAEEIVEDDGDQHDHHRHRLAEGVEHQAGGREDDIAGGVVPDQRVEKKGDRKEHEQKGQGAEGHGTVTSVFLCGLGRAGGGKPGSAPSGKADILYRMIWNFATVF